MYSPGASEIPSGGPGSMLMIFSIIGYREESSVLSHTPGRPFGPLSQNSCFHSPCSFLQPQTVAKPSQDPGPKGSGLIWLCPLSTVAMHGWPGAPLSLCTVAPGNWGNVQHEALSRLLHWSSLACPFSPAPVMSPGYWNLSRRWEGKDWVYYKALFCFCLLGSLKSLSSRRNASFRLTRHT